jgi:hypothetical protein
MMGRLGLALGIALLVVGCGSSSQQGSNDAAQAREAGQRGSGATATVGAQDARQVALKQKWERERKRLRIPSKFQGAAVDAFYAAANECWNGPPYGLTENAAVRRYGRTSQRSPALREAAAAGCRRSLRKHWAGFYDLPPNPWDAAGTPTSTESASPPASAHDKMMYTAEYATCWGISVREIQRDYGFDTSGMTPGEAILAMEQQTYGPQDQATAYEACLDAYYKRPSKY